MARFDVHLAGSGRGYLLNCQADVLDHLSTRVVVPLIRAQHPPEVTRLHPIFEVEGASVVMSTHLIFAIPRSKLGAVVTNLSDDHYDIMAALDLLITGF